MEEVEASEAVNVRRLPGLIDVHIHVREPGETQKEDWDSCTRAALAGGITMICAMPNTTPALCASEDFDVVEALASSKAHCDYALFAGASQDNVDVVAVELAERSAGLKMYLNATHGKLLLPSVDDWDLHALAWSHQRHPICVHAEAATLAAAIFVVCVVRKRRLHVCHVSSAVEIALVREAKLRGLPVTCEVAPHHLFLDLDAAQRFPHEQNVKPPLQLGRDVEALWQNMRFIDCFATDHAPHLRSEKRACGCPGFPGLETALPLLLTAVNEGRLTLEDVVDRYHRNPRRIFNLPEQPDTYVEVDMNRRHTITPQPRYSKADWTPFAGMQCVGAVTKVVFRGATVFRNNNDDNGLTLDNAPRGVNVRLQSSATIDTLNTQPVSASASATIFVPTTTPATMTTMISLRRVTHVLSAEQFTPDYVSELFRMARHFRCGAHEDRRWRGKTLGLFFAEPSTRTRVSFETAAANLGMRVTQLPPGQSSERKGESFIDSVAAFEICGELDAMVLRHSQVGASHRASEVCTCSVINAGDGDGEHPTQALIDLFTLKDAISLPPRGQLQFHQTFVFVGDLRFSRTVHSLVKALITAYPISNFTFYFVAPAGLQVPAGLIDYVNRHASAETTQEFHFELTDDVVEQADVIYVTRMQTERHDAECADQHHSTTPFTIITPELLDRAHAKPTLRVMHALPRGEEIATSMDSDERSLYRAQMENAVCVRMAVLALALSKQ